MNWLWTHACVTCGAAAAASAHGDDVSSLVLAADGLPAGFFQSYKFGTHVALQRSAGAAYVAAFWASVQSGLSVPASARARVLAAAWAVHNVAFVDELLLKPDVIGVNEVSKALQLLDAPRAARQISDKLECIASTAAPATLSRLRTQLQNVSAEMVVGERLGSVTRSLAKRVANWASLISAESLEFYLMSFPTAPWKAVADLCHLKPADFQLPFFLAACFSDAVVPADSLVARGRLLTADNLAATLRDEPRFLSMYSFVRKHIEPSRFSTEAKVLLATGVPLGEVIWFFHEFACAEAAAALEARLAAGESLDSPFFRLNFGKVMQRLLTFKEGGYSFTRHLLELAQARLSTLVAPPSDVRVAVLGDASASMGEAVKAASILGGLLSACFSAELLFFNHKVIHAAMQPRTAEHVIEVASSIVADGGTAPVAALAELYMARKAMDMIIVVTDEEETNVINYNTVQLEGMPADTRVGAITFASLFKLYRQHVNPSAQLVFCSFLQPNVRNGVMCSDLERAGVQSKVFLLNLTCPDLSKFDDLLALVARARAEFVPIVNGPEDELVELIPIHYSNTLV